MTYNLYTSDTRVSDKAWVVKTFYDFIEVKMVFNKVVNKFKKQEHLGKTIEDKSYRFTYEFDDGEVIDLFFIQEEQ